MNLKQVGNCVTSNYTTSESQHYFLLQKRPTSDEGWQVPVLGNFLTAAPWHELPNIITKYKPFLQVWGRRRQGGRRCLLGATEGEPAGPGGAASATNTAAAPAWPPLSTPLTCCFPVKRGRLLRGHGGVWGLLPRRGWRGERWGWVSDVRHPQSLAGAAVPSRSRWWGLRRRGKERGPSAEPFSLTRAAGAETRQTTSGTMSYGNWLRELGLFSPDQAPGGPHRFLQLPERRL